MSDEETETPPLSAAYFAYSFLVGIGLMAVLIYAGFSAWPILPSVLAGAAAQTTYRVLKRMWKNSLTQKPARDEEVPDSYAFRALVLIFVFMIAVSLLWYWVGSLAR